MLQKIYQVDAFTVTLFRGNPAAVCILDDWLETSLMQAIAAENNLSETAFCVKDGDQYAIRWFSPNVEIDLCGHATLATAFVLANFYPPEEQTYVFKSKSGELKAEYVRKNCFRLDFPIAKPLNIITGSQKELVLKIIGLKAEAVLEIKAYSDDWMVVLKDESLVKSLKPDFRLLKTMPIRGLIATAASTNYDFSSRFFAPACGIDEDPVTGSAHTKLAPYWRDRLDKQTLKAYQCSARGGEIRCTLEGERVLLEGQAVLYLEGELRI